MAARAPLISVPKNLYKHFAMLTVAITACVAIFASAENQQEISQRIEHHRVKTVERGPAGGGAALQGLSGLRDNRGSEAGGSDDVGGASGVVSSTIVAVGEVTEGDLASALRRGSQRPIARNTLPPVLPPGMPTAPSLPVEVPALTTVAASAD